LACGWRTDTYASLREKVFALYLTTFDQSQKRRTKIKNCEYEKTEELNMGNIRVKGARLLNERPGWLGLSVWDLGGIGYVLIISNALLRPWGLELLSFLIAGLAFLILLQVRLRSRPKTIRDYLKSKMKSKVISN
jgi:hypothetical protein